MAGARMRRDRRRRAAHAYRRDRGDMKLVLFDIDGTLLLSDGAGRRATHRALREVFGTTGPADYHFDGKTDPQIVRELMRLAGHADDRIDAEMQRLRGRYAGCLDEGAAAQEHKIY